VPALGLLFIFLSACFLGLAYAAATAGKVAGWVVAVAAVALAIWLCNLAITLMRRRR
jgi:hypothetical protein